MQIVCLRFDFTTFRIPNTFSFQSFLPFTEALLVNKNKIKPCEMQDQIHLVSYRKLASGTFTFLTFSSLFNALH